MILNHKAESLDKALLLNGNQKDEIIDICINYNSQLSVTVIIEMICKSYGFGGVVFASYILGQLANAYIKESLNEKSNLLKQWQREN